MHTWKLVVSGFIYFINFILVLKLKIGYDTGHVIKKSLNSHLLLNSS